MKLIGYILLCVPVFILLSCEQKRDTTMYLTNVNVDSVGYLPSLVPYNWYKTFGDVTVDISDMYKNQKSLRLVPSENDSSKMTVASFLYDLERIDGDTIAIEGKYKLKEASDAEISLMIVQYASSNYSTNKVETISIDSTGGPDWKHFYIKSAIDETTGKTFFTVYGKGDIDILLSDCRTWIDETPLSDILNREFEAEKDMKFDDGSGIELGELTPQMLENLEVLGKVWGFMKYYHPEVTRGKYNWDYELFRVLPRIARAKDKKQRDMLLSKWIDKYGKINETAEYTILDSTKYSRFVDLNWLNNRKLFDEQLIIKLNDIKNAPRSKKVNYYVVSHKMSNGWLDSKHEKKYKTIKWDDQGYRILTLFRLWNVIEYYFPYTHYTDTPWETLLKDFLPRFVSPEDQPSYELAIMELAARIDDSHGHLQIPDNKLVETVLEPMYAGNRLPVELTQSAEGHIVVKSSRSEFLHRGDIVVSIEGKDVNDIIEEMSPYIGASNRNGLVRNISRYLMSSRSNQINVGVIRDGGKIEVHVKHFKSDREFVGRKSWREYNLADLDIIHVDNIKSDAVNRETVESNMNSKGLIIDMRRYPGKLNQHLLSTLLLSKYPLWISENDKSCPGNYRVKDGYDKINMPETEPNYKGKIVILVDENTQSAGESWAMMHRLAPNSVIIGRQTAGANGNIGRIYLPGGIQFTYTQLGAYYPNWEVLQRKGVKIDIPVSPTVDDIKAGRDVWIEKAIEIIEDI